MASRKRPRSASRRPVSRPRRRHLPTLLGGAALAAAGCGTLAYAAITVSRGWMDARSRFAHTPDYLYAAAEPLWFYGLTAALVALGVAALAVGVRMVLHGWRTWTDDH